MTTSPRDPGLKQLKSPLGAETFNADDKAECVSLIGPSSEVDEGSVRFAFHAPGSLFNNEGERDETLAAGDSGSRSWGANGLANEMQAKASESKSRMAIWEMSSIDAS